MYSLEQRFLPYRPASDRFVTRWIGGAEMGMRFINYPHYMSFGDYEHTIKRMVTRLCEEEGVVSIYQIGNVGAPGISDIDLLVIFENDAVSTLDPLNGLSKEERYLFTHSLFGISRSHFYEVQPYTFLHNYNLLWGEALEVGRNTLPDEDASRLKRHIALEFLLASYFSRSVETVYGVVSVRNLLLSTHALRYDMEFLNVTTGTLYDLIVELIEWRTTWFEKTVGSAQLHTWYEAFYAELSLFLETHFKEEPFFLPAWTHSRYARHISLEGTDQLGFIHQGMVPPRLLGSFGKKYVRFLNRFNQFRFGIPLTNQADHDVLDGFFTSLRDVNQYNAKKLRKFSLFSSPLVSRLTR